MSHLRAPATRADRREGGRHGRPVARPAPVLPETHIRPQLLRLAVLPPIAVALSGCAAVLFTVRSTGTQPGLILWGVLAGAVSVALAGILIAAVAADRAAKSVSDRLGTLRRSSARREAELRALVEGLRRGEVPPGRSPRSGPADDADDFELLAADLDRAHDGAVSAVVQAAQLSSQVGSEQKLEVFVNLARRLQSLVHREISILDELENEIEDPDLLKGLFHVDHLATRIRRHAENLAVLGGAVSRRQWSNPVSMTEVLRSAIAEVEQYSRVKLVPPIDGTLRGHAVADVIHLLAELVENATVFSAPHTQVLLRANLVTSGLAVEVEDRGLGMPVTEQQRMNALLADPDQVNVASLLADGRIGLFVVSQLAKRHGIHVRLQTNIYGGVQAVLVVPQALLGSAPGAVGAQPPEAAGAGVPPQGPEQPRSGHEARHRGVPAEPRPGADPRRREPSSREPSSHDSVRPVDSGRNGSRTPGANGRGAVSGGNGSAPNGSGSLPDGTAVRGVGGRGSGGSGPLPGGGRRVSGGVGAGSGGGSVAPGGGGGSDASASLPVGGGVPGAAVSSGGVFWNGGSGVPEGGGASGGGRVVGESPSGGGVFSSGVGGVSTGSGHLPGGGAVVPEGGGGASGGGRVVGESPSGGGVFSSGVGGVSTGSGHLPGGGAVVPDGGGRLPRRDGGGVPRGSEGAAGGGSLSRDRGAASGGGRPTPLPVRGARAERANPADAVPGIRAGDRRLVAEHTAAPPTPRTGTVRGTMGKPQLPRRRAQEHIAPQLRGGPAAPRQDPEYLAGHDPGLMAAFQRGISLAEAQQHLEPADGDPDAPLAPAEAARLEFDHMDSTPMTSPYGGAAHTEEPGQMEPGRMGPGHVGSAHVGAGHRDAGDLGSGRVGSGHTDAGDLGSGRVGSGHMAAGDLGSGRVGSGHMAAEDPGPGHAGSAHLGSLHMGSAHTDTPTTEPSHTESAYSHTARTHTGPPASIPLQSRPTPSPDPSASFDFGASHTDAAPTTEAAAIDVTPMERPHISEVHGGRDEVPGLDLDLDRTTPRHDGSAPAG
ncbi:ATP-binding protein [Streptomyces sp. NPDC048420]|uniref:sensor histidine kinase n=1 Tax=Streptomyces sp. NPDC048420 TaxID=3155755 RepID=UPI003431B20B